MKSCIILNPKAGRGLAARRRADVERALQAAGVAYDLVETDKRLGAHLLAERAVEHGYPQVIAVGGDGTLNEVINGVLAGQARSGRQVAVGIVPIGTGNDFIKSLDGGAQNREPRTENRELRTENIERRAQSAEHRAQSAELRTESAEHRTESAEHRTESAELRTESAEHRIQNSELRTESAELRTESAELRTESAERRAQSYEVASAARWFDLEYAAGRIAAGQTRTIDVGRVMVESDADAAITRYFINGLGMGMDAQVTVESDKLHYLSGPLVYYGGIAAAFFSYRAKPMRVQAGEIDIEQRLLFASIGNGRCQGGSFYITPQAQIDDGLLDLCVVENMPVLKMLRALPLLTQGEHTGLPQVTMTRATEIVVSSAWPFPVATDGEVVATAARRATVTIEAGAIALLQ